MRTAEEYLRNALIRVFDMGADTYIKDHPKLTASLIAEINEARSECIDECANCVTLGTYVSNTDKQSILKLKEQIK